MISKFTIKINSFYFSQTITYNSKYMNENDLSILSKEKKESKKDLKGIVSYINSLKAVEETYKDNPILIYVDDYNLKGEQDDVVRCFYDFCNFCSLKDYQNTLQALVNLRCLAQTLVLNEFKEFFKYRIPQISVSLMVDSPIELQKEFIRFITELGKSPKQKLFEHFIKCSLFENINHSAFLNFSNEYFIVDILKFYEESLSNFESVRTQILRLDSLNLFNNIIKNERFSKQTRTIPIQIMSKLSNYQKEQYQLLNKTLSESQFDPLYFQIILTQISLILKQMSQIIDFLTQFLQNQHFDVFWNDLLQILRSMIFDEKTYQNVISKIQNICLNFIMDNKSVPFCKLKVIAISILNFHFTYYSTPLQIFNKEVHFKMLLKFAKGKSDALSRATLLIIKNMMANNFNHFSLFLSLNIVPIAIDKISHVSKLCVKYEAVSIMALVVMKGNMDQHILCIKSGFIHYFLELASIDSEKFINLVIPPLLTLLDIGTKNPQLSFVWQMFDENDGFSIISNLSNSTDSNIAHNANSLETFIINMRNSLNK